MVLCNDCKNCTGLMVNIEKRIILCTCELLENACSIFDDSECEAFEPMDRDDSEN